ncbi:MAG: asparagine synthase (glutamine-hydrolyzing), partial [Chlamydiota bacterium]
MTTRISHRGPDASGYYYKGQAALGHRRLAILDLEASTQPMMSADGRYVLAYNGELYNFRELKRELEALGKTFRTAGDTEVLLQALIEWGEEVLPRLQGMFAFAFWDAAEEHLLLARDHLGVKPLHIFWDGQRLLFASEIKALLEHPAVSREIDSNAIGLYLECQYIPAPFTIYQQIRKLPAAHLLSLKKGVFKQRRYWVPSYLPKFEFDEETALEKLEAELKRSVASMLISDVPLGVFVSGGIDSSLIAALMQREAGHSPKIFHLGFENPEHSEHIHAARVASFLGAEHHPLIVHANDMI